MESGDDTKYISLQEATEHCGYSRDYLNLRIRQGRLKGVKIGRNWVTTRQWLKDYMDSVSDIQYSTAGGYETSSIQKAEPLDKVEVRNVSDVVFESHLTREEFEKLPGQLASAPPQLLRRYWRVRTSFAPLVASLVLIVAVTTGYAFAQTTAKFGLGNPADIMESDFVNGSSRFINDANNRLVSSNGVFLGEISRNPRDGRGNNYHGLLTFIDASIRNVKIPSVNLPQLSWAWPRPRFSWPDLSHISISQFSPPRF